MVGRETASKSWAQGVVSATGASASQRFPREEIFGLRAQLRRRGVSVPSNIVEGCARNSEADYLHFLDIAYASSREVEYVLSVAGRLGYLEAEAYRALSELSAETSKVLAGLVRALCAKR